MRNNGIIARPSDTTHTTGTRAPWISILRTGEGLSALLRDKRDAARSDTRDLRRYHGQGSEESRNES